jgi:hypothetical protein
VQARSSYFCLCVYRKVHSEHRATI